MSDELLDDIDFEVPGVSKQEMESYLEIFIGKREDIYVKYWKNPETLTISWIKMLIGVPWLLYRKMYELSFFLALITYIIGGIKHLFFIVPIYGITYIILELKELGWEIALMYLVSLFPTMILCGILTKNLYLRYAKVKIRKLKEKYTDEAEFLEQLEQQGGVEGFFPSMILVGLLMYLLSSISLGMNTILTF